MDRNFRSSPMMTEAVNTLFSSGKNPFIIDESEIGYKPVKPKETDSPNELIINGCPHHGIEIRYLSALDPKYSAFTTGSRKFPEKQKIKLAPVKGIVFDDLCSKILELPISRCSYQKRCRIFSSSWKLRQTRSRQG